MSILLVAPYHFNYSLLFYILFNIKFIIYSVVMVSGNIMYKGKNKLCINRRYYLTVSIVVEYLYSIGSVFKINVGKYCLKSKMTTILYNYRLVLSKMYLLLLLKKGGKSLVFHYRDAIPLFFKRKVESGILFLKSLLAGGFYYHSLRSRQKVESGKVSGDF